MSLRKVCARCRRARVGAPGIEGLRGPCPRCMRAAAAPAIPTFDVVIGHESDGHRERLVRIQRVDGMVRLMGAVRLDQSAVNVLGTFTVPVRMVRELQRALDQITRPARGTATAR